MNSTTLAFFDAYLRADPAAKTYLTSDQLNREANDLATLTAK